MYARNSFNFDSLRTTSFWIALDDSTLQNGCLHFLRSSHDVVGGRAEPFTPAGVRDPQTGKALSSSEGPSAPHDDTMPPLHSATLPPATLQVEADTCYM
jgi:hypothetical protein